MYFSEMMMMQSNKIQPTRRMMINLGNEYLQEGKIIEAEKQFERALLESREMFGEDSIKLAAPHEGLAKVMERRGKLDCARAHAEEVLRLRRVDCCGGASGVDVALALRHLGMLMKKLGKIEEALAAMHEAENIWFLIFGDDHSLLAETHMELARLYETKGDGATAISHYHAASRIFLVSNDFSDAFLHAPAA